MQKLIESPALLSNGAPQQDCGKLFYRSDFSKKNAP